MTPFIVPMWSLNATGRASVTIDLGLPRPFLAWATITMIDSLASFDRDNYVAADIFMVDGVVLPWRVGGGDHFGPPGQTGNLRPGAWAGFGRRIVFGLKTDLVFSRDLEAYGEAIVLTLD